MFLLESYQSPPRMQRETIPPPEQISFRGESFRLLREVRGSVSGLAARWRSGRMKLLGYLRRDRLRAEEAPGRRHPAPGGP